MSKRASRNRKQFGRIEASASPALLYMTGEPESFAIEAASGASKVGRFTATGYSGGPMYLPEFRHPVIAEISGMKIPRQSIPILRQHDPERIVAHTDAIDTSAQRVKLSGPMSGIGAAADEVRQLAANGFPWQMSIGASVEGQLEFVEPGKVVKINGRNFTGPVFVARATTLREVSFVPIGADTGTSATLAASLRLGESAMDEKLAARLKADGIDPVGLTAEGVANMKAMYAMKDAKAEPEKKPEIKAEAVPTADNIRAAGDAMLAASADKALENYRNTVVAEQIRVDAVTRLAAKYENPRLDDGTTIQAKAIAAGWDAQKTELEMLLVARGTGAPNFFMASQKRDHEKPDVLEASIALARNLPNVEKAYKPETLEAAHKHFRNFGLQQLFLTAAAANGYHCGPGHKITNGNLREVLHAAFGTGGIRASGFSTVPLPNILGNVANKELLAGYMEEDSTWREIGGIKSVSNFHAVTSYRMLDDMSYEKLGPAGEIVHGKVSEESYTRQADTYAKMFALTRRDIVNDDLGAFDDLRNRLGRGSAQKFNDVFWTEFLSDASTFWTTARTNYITGSTTTLLTDGVGLALGVKAFRQMVTPTADGSKRIAGRPEILLVPPELEYAADNLFMGEKINVGSGPGDRNIYANKYRPVVSAWLSDSNFTGYSTTAWYLLRSPTIAPAVVVSFLNGMQTPTVESAEADFNTLGVQFRGYHDFGVDQAEYLAGIKSKGAA